MTPDQIIARAKEKNATYRVLRDGPEFQKTIAWFTYLGLLQHNRIKPARFKVTLADVLVAARVEPRILEILPAVLAKVPDVLVFKFKDLPADLKAVLRGIREGVPVLKFRNVTAEEYTQWLDAPCIEVAKKRLSFRKTPRASFKRSTELGEMIKLERRQLTLTQKEFAEKHDISLGMLREIEQGKTSISFRSVEKILNALGRKLYF